MTKIHPIAKWINNSKVAQKFLKNVNDNPGLWGSGIATAGFTLVLRPMSINACMQKDDKKDRQYSIASSFAAGTMDLLGTILIFNGVNSSIKTASDNLYKAKGTVYHENPAVLRQFKSVTNRGIKLLALIPLSLCRFSIIKPIVKTFFDKGKNDENK